MTLLRSLVTRFPWLIALLLGVGLPVAVFAKTAQEVWEEGGFSFDTPTLMFIHRFASPALDHLMVGVTTTAGTHVLPVVTLLLAALFWWRHHRHWAAYLVLAVAGAAGLMFVIKNLVHRVRPHLWVSPAPETDWGFPSGHSIASLSLVLALTLLAWPTRWRWPVLLLGGGYALLVGFSRLYLGVHYPSDVLGAWGAGAAWTAGLYWVLFQKRGAA
ncbi:phosphatase PAP2 family protein [Deinococcus aluminii]|uniref:Phosphatidic acid phosphatase type 2/haloperoxidase domain-containing protein n=1 Tax=Deinococcus aluminii TaxID=1656885 RepID=A0ABP9XFA1_9DEIO